MLGYRRRVRRKHFLKCTMRWTIELEFAPESAVPQIRLAWISARIAGIGEFRDDPAQQPDEPLGQAAAIPPPLLEILASLAVHLVDSPQVQRRDLVQTFSASHVQQTYQES
jgi:hypothetical protein